MYSISPFLLQLCLHFWGLFRQRYHSHAQPALGGGIFRDWGHNRNCGGSYGFAHSGHISGVQTAQISRGKYWFFTTVGNVGVMWI